MLMRPRGGREAGILQLWREKSHILMMANERLAWHLCSSSFLLVEARSMRSWKSVGLYICLLVSYNVAAVGKWVVPYIVKLGLIFLCSVCARSFSLFFFFFFFPISQLGLRQRGPEVFVVFPPKALKIKNELSLAQAPWKLGDFNRHFCPISLQRVGCNYYKCHGNKLGGFHSDSCHCRNSTTENKNYLSSNSLCSSKSCLFNSPLGCTWHNTSKCSHRSPVWICLGPWKSSHSPPGQPAPGLEGFWCLHRKCLTPRASPYS